MKIKVKLNGSKPLKIITKGDWIDVYTAEDITLEGPKVSTLKGNAKRDVKHSYYYINLGIAIELPKGYEAWLLPRSSTFKKYKITCANSMGIIDNSFCGDNDIWKLLVISYSDCIIPKGTKIAQFRISLSQFATIRQKLKWLFSNKLEIEEVNNLNNNDRGGFGSTN